MNTPSNRRAFTLIELLTVMAIITLLIGLLTPALSGARDKARSTHVQAQINAMSVGLEHFWLDNHKYPPSNARLYSSVPADATEMDWWEVCPVSTPKEPYQGAHLLVDALVGRDMLGYDPRAKMSTDDTYDRWDPNNDRVGPYIPKDGVDLSSTQKPPEDSGGVIPTESGNCGPQPVHSPDNLLVRTFVDKFGWPILYYRANPTANQSTPIIQEYDPTTTDFGDGVYDGYDNTVFTSYKDASNKHRIKDANTFYKPTSFPVTSISNKFADFIHSLRATTYDTVKPTQIKWPRPVKADTFILLSAGKEGLYGTLDDVANFNVLSQDR